MTYLLGFLWGFVLLACFAGWGLALGRALKLSADVDSPEWGKLIVLGMAWVVAVGGFFNLLHVMTRGMVWLILIGGLVLFVAVTWELCARIKLNHVFAWRPTRFDTLVLVLCLAAYGSSICLCESPYGDASLRQRFTLNPWDDLGGGYITYPLRLLSEGTLGDDWFNDRRSISALGGLSVLQAFALLFLPPTYIHIMDPGLAILALPFVLNGLVPKKTSPIWLPAALYGFCLILRPHWVNASAQVLPNLFLLCLFRSMGDISEQKHVRIASLFEMAMYASAAVTLKSLFVPGTCLILGVYFALEAITRGNLIRALFAGAVFGLMFILLLVPWLVANYFASGTPLYPLLGAGFRGNPMVEIPHLPSIKDLVTKPPLWVKSLGDPRPLAFFFLGGLGLASMLKRDPRDSRSTAYVAFFLGILPILFLFAAAFGDGFMRYTSNYIVPFLVISFARLLGGEEERAWLDRIVPGGWKLLGGGLILATLLGGAVHCVRLPQTVRMVWKAIQGTGWEPDAGLSAYRRMQSSIPAGESFLAFVPMAHLLDFARNRIYVVDTNCAVSPPPGMPLRKSPAEVVEYLQSLGIFWVAGREIEWTPAGESRDIERLRNWGESYKENALWDGSVVTSHYLMAKCIRSLSLAYETAHFDDGLIVINLRAPRRGNTGAGALTWSDLPGSDRRPAKQPRIVEN